MENNTLCNRHSLGVNNHTKMYFRPVGLRPAGRILWFFLRFIFAIGSFFPKKVQKKIRQRAQRVSASSSGRGKITQSPDGRGGENDGSYPPATMDKALRQRQPRSYIRSCLKMIPITPIGTVTFRICKPVFEGSAVENSVHRDGVNQQPVLPRSATIPLRLSFRQS